jgi:hypothetical protein
MAITVKHKFVSAIPDAGDPTIVQPSNWNDTHDLTGLGTMAEQNANAVAITGGTMSGVAITGYIPTTEKAVANGVATLDGSGTVPINQLPAAVLGALSYQGTWNASTNTPTLTSSVGTKGYYYVVNVAGSTNLNGITDWVIGDWAVFNGSIWQKVDNTDAVTSVNGYTGTVVLTQPDISGTVPTSRTITAGTGLTGGGDLSANRTLAIDSTVVTLTGTQTLTNKTLTTPIIGQINDVNSNEILLLTPVASATDYFTLKNGIGVGVPLHIVAEGSSTNIGMHIQPKGTGLVTISDGTDFNKGIRFRSSGSAASAITLLDAVATAGRVVTLPDATTTLVGRDTTDTLTNKSISGTTNTLSNIGNSSLTNSAITINGTSTSLGGSINVGTVTSVDLTASTGISVSGGPITGSGSITVTNTAPDQTVAIASGTGISVTGTYPNFTVTNTSPSSGGTVTSVTGTAPVVSSGGNTPAISMAAANTTTNGYLTSTDWNTFNGKSNTNGTVTSVAALTLGTTGTDLSSTVATGTTTPVITLQVPTASATNRGALSSTDWSTFNGKAPAVTYTSTYVPYGQGTTTPALSSSFTFDGTTQSAPIQRASNGIVINAKSISASYSIASGDNGLSVGPVTVASGQTITVASGSRWVVL